MCNDELVNCEHQLTDYTVFFCWKILVRCFSIYTPHPKSRKKILFDWVQYNSEFWMNGLFISQLKLNVSIIDNLNNKKKTEYHSTMIRSVRFGSVCLHYQLVLMMTSSSSYMNPSQSTTVYIVALLLLWSTLVRYFCFFLFFVLFCFVLFVIFIIWWWSSSSEWKQIFIQFHFLFLFLQNRLGFFCL